MSGVNTGAFDPQGSRVFVGREREMGELREGLAKALSGEVQLFGVTGPRGIGKTRLADELSVEARRHGARVLWGRCWGGEGAPVFWPWLQVIRSCAAVTGVSALEPFVSTIGRLMPELGPRVSDQAVLTPTRREDAGYPLLDAIVGLLARAAQSQPLVLVLDDLHAADGPSIRALQFVARALCDVPVLIVGTREPTAPATPDRSALFATLCQHGQHVPLGGLGEADVARVVEAFAGVHPSAPFVEALHDLTQGNPFFLDEIMGHLRAERRLAVVRALTPPALPIPAGVREVIHAGLEALSDSARRVLSIAAAVGRTFDLGSVQQACDLPVEALLEALGSAAAAGCLDEVDSPTPRFAFAHPLIRETLHRYPSTRGRAWLPARVGDPSAVQAGAPAPVLTEWWGSPELSSKNGSEARAKRGSAPERVDPSRSRERRVLRREGEYWTVVFDGEVVHVRDTLGLRWLARLMRQPNQEVRAIDLAGSDNLGLGSAGPGVPAQRPSAPTETTLAVRRGLGDAGEVLDARAKAAYAQRLQELRVEREEALQRGDTEEAARADEESEILARELARAVGLAGRGRRAASPAERARVNVTRRIRSAVSKIAAHHPRLGQHLAMSIKTGYVCSYIPVPAELGWWES